MPRFQLRIVPEIPVSCRAAKGISGALIVVALAGLIVANARPDQDAPLRAPSMPEENAVGRASPAAAPRDTGYFPAGYTLNASEPTPHIETF